VPRRVSKFEYVTVFESILLAIAVSEILSGLGRMLRERERVRFYWVHLLWMLLVLVASTQYWWNLWSYRRIAFDSILDMVALFLPTIALILASFLLVPPLPERGELDVRRHYHKVRAWLFPLVALMLAEIAAVRWLVGVEPLWNPVNGIRAVAIAVFAALGFVEDERLHAAAASLAALLLVGSIVIDATVGIASRTG
jgi:hypothetical protein